MPKAVILLVCEVFLSITSNDAICKVLRVLSSIFNSISVILWWSVLLMEESADKTTDLLQVINKLYHIRLYLVHFTTGSQNHDFSGDTDYVE